MSFIQQIPWVLVVLLACLLCEVNSRGGRGGGGGGRGGFGGGRSGGSRSSSSRSSSSKRVVGVGLVVGAGARHRANSDDMEGDGEEEEFDYVWTDEDSGPSLFVIFLIVFLLILGAIAIVFLARLCCIIVDNVTPESIWEIGNGIDNGASSTTGDSGVHSEGSSEKGNLSIDSGTESPRSPPDYVTALGDFSPGQYSLESGLDEPDTAGPSGSYQTLLVTEKEKH